MTRPPWRWAPTFPTDVAATGAATERAVTELLAAVESRDVRAIEAALAPSVTWQNVPHEPAVGRPAVARLLGDVVTWSDEVRWDVVSASFGDDRAWVERIDRFVIDGTEHAVRCNGVFGVFDGVVAEVRDYVDLGEWRARVGPALAVMADRSGEAVVRRHLDGVLTLDPVRMAADYAHDAVLVRPDGERRGRHEIADYFDTVPDRLGGGELEFGPIEQGPDDTIVVRWRMTRPDAPVVPGSDSYEIEAGRIVRQTVRLDGTDF